MQERQFCSRHCLRSVAVDRRSGAAFGVCEACGRARPRWLRLPGLTAVLAMGAAHLEKACQGLSCMSFWMSDEENPAAAMAGTNSSGIER